MNHFRVLMPLVLSIAITGSVCGQQNRGEDRQRRSGFEQFFTLPGIQFSKEQQAKVDEIRKEFSSQLVANQNQWNAIITDEQQRAIRQAMREAREKGKSGRDLRQAVEAAVKWTDEQLRQRTAIQKKRNDLVAKIRGELNAVLTDEQRTTSKQRARERARNQVSPTHANVKYGPHERNVMDVWLAKSSRPTPVLVSIHGGGFRGGNKSVSAGLLRQCLDSGISVVAITYRFSSQAIAPAAFRDSARAVQYVRHMSEDWNIDVKRFAATGGSAGAGISLWLGFHDDLADPDNEDPILRQSTRLTCMMVTAGQSSYDPRFIRKLFPEFATYKHSALAQLFDVDLNNLDDLPEEKYKLFEEVSPIHHLTKDDVPALLSYGGSLDQEVTNVNIGIHHARFGEALKQEMDALGIRCEVHAGRQVLGGGKRTSQIEFLKQSFGMVE